MSAELPNINSRLGVRPTLDPSAETFRIGPMRQPRDGRGVDRCVYGVRAVYGEGRKVGLGSLSGISKRAPVAVAYCLT